MGEERGALLGDADRARGAVEEAGGELVLQRLDAFGDGARRQAELGAHSGQILHRRDAGKNAHVLDVHCRPPTPDARLPRVCGRRTRGIVFSYYYSCARTLAANAPPFKRDLRRHVPTLLAIAAMGQLARDSRSGSLLPHGSVRPRHVGGACRHWLRALRSA